MNVLPLEIVIVGILFLAPIILFGVFEQSKAHALHTPIVGFGGALLAMLLLQDIEGNVNGSPALAVCGMLIALLPPLFMLSQLFQQQRARKQAIAKREKELNQQGQQTQQS